MPVPLRPKLRLLEVVSVGAKEEFLLALRDPEGFGQTRVLPYGAVALAALMNGRRTLAEVRAEFRKQTGVTAAMEDLLAIVVLLDEARLLDNARFRRYRKAEIARYLAGPVRPASHAGGAYAAEPETLRQELQSMFAAVDGSRSLDACASDGRGPLCGVLSPHIDPGRGGAAYACAYKAVAERGDADLFVIFGTAHGAMNQLFCASRKDFATPLGIVRTDQAFIDRLAGHLASSVAGRCVDLFADELAHRAEHSIEFQAMCLQYVLGGRREFRIVPILTGSFEEFLAAGTLPGDAPEVHAFLTAVRAAAAGHAGKVCYVSGADFAHVGRRFGDRWLVDGPRLAVQSDDDRALLELACRCDAAGFFQHVAAGGDRSRICGLAPTYAMLEILGSARGRLLSYGQAVEPDGTACVSFAAAEFYR